MPTRVELTNHVTIRAVIIHQALCRMQMPGLPKPHTTSHYICVLVSVLGFSHKLTAQPQPEQPKK